MKKECFDDFLRLSTTTTIQDEKDGYYSFEDTVIWGEKGGALPDKGTINGLPVLDLKWEDNTFWYKVDGILTDPIHMEIDPDTRMINTAVQSALHLMDGYYGRRGSTIVAIGIHPDHQWYEIDEKDVSDQDLADAQAYLNQAIRDQIPVEFSYVRGKDYPDPAYQNFDFVRIVRYGDLDQQPCSTPHLNHTGQIGSFVILDKEKTSRGTRILITCNLVTNQRLKEYYTKLKTMEKAIRCNEDELVDRVEALVENEKKQRKEISDLKDQLNQYLAQDLAKDPSHLHVLKDMDGGALRSLGQSLLQQNAPDKILLSDQGNRTGLVIASAGNKARDILAAMKELAPVKGGGSPQLVNGQAAMTTEELEEALKKLNWE